MFKAAVAMVPVTNLFQRLAWKGVERQHQAIDPANRYGGLPAERHDVYKDRSPLYNVDKLQIPLLRRRHAQRRGRQHRGGHAAGRRAARRASRSSPRR